MDGTIIWPTYCRIKITTTTTTWTRTRTWTRKQRIDSTKIVWSRIKSCIMKIHDSIDSSLKVTFLYCVMTATMLATYVMTILPLLEVVYLRSGTLHSRLESVSAHILKPTMAKTRSLHPMTQAWSNCYRKEVWYNSYNYNYNFIT